MPRANIMSSSQMDFIYLRHCFPFLLPVVRELFLYHSLVVIEDFLTSLLSPPHLYITFPSNIWSCQRIEERETKNSFPYLVQRCARELNGIAFSNSKESLYDHQEVLQSCRLRSKIGVQYLPHPIGRKSMCNFTQSN